MVSYVVCVPLGLGLPFIGIDSVQRVPLATGGNGGASRNF